MISGAEEGGGQERGEGAKTRVVDPQLRQCVWITLLRIELPADRHPFRSVGTFCAAWTVKLEHKNKKIIHSSGFMSCFFFHREHWDRQAGRQTGRQTGRQAGRQTGRQTDKQTDRQTDRQADRQTGRQTDRQTDIQADRQTGRQIDRYTDRQINK